MDDNNLPQYLLLDRYTGEVIETTDTIPTEEKTENQIRGVVRNNKKGFAMVLNNSELFDNSFDKMSVSTYRFYFAILNHDCVPVLRGESSLTNTRNRFAGRQGCELILNSKNMEEVLLKVFGTIKSNKNRQRVIKQMVSLGFLRKYAVNSYYINPFSYFKGDHYALRVCQENWKRN